MSLQNKLLTSNSYAVTCNCTCLNHGVLLSCKRFGDISCLLNNFCPCPDKQEGNKSSWDIQVRDPTCCEVQFHGYHTVNRPNQDAYNHSPHSDLLCPWLYCPWTLGFFMHLFYVLPLFLFRILHLFHALCYWKGYILKSLNKKNSLYLYPYIYIYNSPWLGWPSL